MSTELRTAVSIAINFVREMYTKDDIYDLLLEEVEMSNDGFKWLITVSFSRRKTQIDPIASIQIKDNQIEEREYKIITIDKETGFVESMKIRKL